MVEAGIDPQCEEIKAKSAPRTINEGNSVGKVNSHQKMAYQRHSQSSMGKMSSNNHDEAFNSNNNNSNDKNFNQEGYMKGGLTTMKAFPRLNINIVSPNNEVNEDSEESENINLEGNIPNFSEEEEIEINTLYVSSTRLKEISPILYNRENRKSIPVPYFNFKITKDLKQKHIKNEKLEINDETLPECMILGKYFPQIKREYEKYLNSNKERITNEFDIAKSSYEIFNEYFPDVQINTDGKLFINILVYLDINIMLKGREFTVNLDNFIKNSSILLWDKITLYIRDIELIIPEVIVLQDQINKSKNEKIDERYTNELEEIYINIVNYLVGKHIQFSKNNYEFLLSFAHTYKLKELYRLCSQIREKGCILSHTYLISEVMCPRCRNRVCIDCHLFQILEDIKGSKDDSSKHKNKLHKNEFISALSETHPNSSAFNNPGFYPYTSVMSRMSGDPIIDPVPIYSVTKSHHQLMKILKITKIKSGIPCYYAIKQIVPVRGYEEKVIAEAKKEYEILRKLSPNNEISYNRCNIAFGSDLSILTYNSGCNNEVFEMLMEDWGVPMYKLNYISLAKESKKLIYQIFQGLAENLSFLHQKGIYHGDIKLDNIIINKVCWVTKFIDFGSSIIFENEEGLCRKRNTVDDKIIEFMYIFTRLYAPPEQLSASDKSKNIEYYLNKVDIFCLGMVFFFMVTNADNNLRYDLYKLRNDPQRSAEYILKMNECLENCKEDHLTNDREFNHKIIEIIKCCLNLNPELRPDAYKLRAMFQYINNFSLPLTNIDTEDFQALQVLNSLTYSQVIENLSSVGKSYLNIFKFFTFLSKEVGITYLIGAYTGIYQEIPYEVLVRLINLGLEILSNALYSKDQIHPYFILGYAILIHAAFMQGHLDQMREPLEKGFEITKRIYQFRPNSFRALLCDHIIVLNVCTDMDTTKYYNEYKNTVEEFYELTDNKRGGYDLEERYSKYFKIISREDILPTHYISRSNVNLDDLSLGQQLKELLIDPFKFTQDVLNSEEVITTMVPGPPIEGMGYTRILKGMQAAMNGWNCFEHDKYDLAEKYYLEALYLFKQILKSSYLHVICYRKLMWIYLAKGYKLKELKCLYELFRLDWEDYEEYKIGALPINYPEYFFSTLNHLCKIFLKYSIFSSA